MEVFKKKTFKALAPTTSAAGAANSNSEGNLKKHECVHDEHSNLFCIFFNVAFHLEKWVVVVPVALTELCPWSHKTIV